MLSLFKLVSIVVALSMLLLSGCSASQAKLRYVWPLPPEEPKIEYLGVYSNQQDLVSDDFVSKYITGGDESPLRLINPQMAAGDGKGRVYVTDSKLAAVLVFDFNARKVELLGGEGAIGLFSQPSGIAIDSDGTVYVADSYKRKIMLFGSDGRSSGALDLSEKLKSIGLIAIDKQLKRIVVPDPQESKVYVVDFKGNIIISLPDSESPLGGFKRPNAAAVAPNGEIVVADSYNARVVLFSIGGKYLSEFGVRGENLGQFDLIQGIAVDSGGHIYISDARTNRFTIMNRKGEALMAIGSKGDSIYQIGKFEIPFGISIDQNDTIYVVERYFARFQKYQYLNADYLSKNPIKVELLAKPVADGKKTAKPSAVPLK